MLADILPNRKEHRPNSIERRKSNLPQRVKKSSGKTRTVKTWYVHSLNVNLFNLKTNLTNLNVLSVEQRGKKVGRPRSREMVLLAPCIRLQ